VIAGITAGKRRSRPLVGPGAVGVLAGAAVVAVVAAGTIFWPDSGDSPIAGPTSGAPASPSAGPDQLAEEKRRADELQRRLAQLDADKRAAAAKLSAQLDKIAADVTMRGVIVRREPNAVRLLFDQGLFTTGTDLAPQADGLLARLAPKLTHTKVTVIGHSVVQPGDNPTGGTRTALARARLASQHLADAGDLPLTTFTLTTADQSKPPFPDAPRNRTVTLLLTPP
jgi:type VI secretion system protein ImpK